MCIIHVAYSCPRTAQKGRKGYWKVGLGGVDLDERHEVLFEPRDWKLEVVEGRGEKVEATTAVQKLQTQQILQGENNIIYNAQ